MERITDSLHMTSAVDCGRNHSLNQPTFIFLFNSIQHLLTFTNTATVIFLNFRMPEIYAVIYLKFNQGQTLSVFCQKDANGKANSEDPDQTAPLGAV